MLDEGLKPENVLQEQRFHPKKVGIRKVLGFASSQPAIKHSVSDCILPTQILQKHVKYDVSPENAHNRHAQKCV